jgi:hypothetical protein
VFSDALLGELWCQAIGLLAFGLLTGGVRCVPLVVRLEHRSCVGMICVPLVVLCVLQIKLFGVCTPSCAVFGTRFPYKLGQLFSAKQSKIICHLFFFKKKEQYMYHEDDVAIPFNKHSLRINKNQCKEDVIFRFEDRTRKEMLVLPTS